MTAPLRLTGLVAAGFTPTTADGALALDVVPALVEHVYTRGISALFLCGSTGEGASLTGAERRNVTEAYLDAVAGRIPVIVHVGHNALGAARSLATHAQRIGADAIAVAPPNYFRPRDVHAVARWLAEVAAGAPNLPLYYYHIPRLTGVDLPVLELLRCAPRMIPTLAGVKYSDFTMDDLLRCVLFDDGAYEIMFGADEMLLAGLACGARSAVGSTYNFMAPLYHAIIEAFAAGDLPHARTLQARAAEIIHAIVRHPAQPALKATMGLAGIDVGPPRPPLTALDGEATHRLDADLRAAGFFDWIDA